MADTRCIGSKVETGTLMKNVKEKVAPAVEYFAESTTACIVTMVQGNFLALTVGHLLIASQTGIISGVFAAIALFFARTDRRWLISIILGVITAVVDYFVHPDMIGAVVSEAIMTGVAAGVLSYIAGSMIQFFRNRRNITTNR